MATGDVQVYGPCKPSDLDALLTGNSIVVADNISMCSYGVGMVVVVVIKA